VFRYNMSTSDSSCKEGSSKSNCDGVCEMNDMLHKMSTEDKDEDISVCANCGKEGSDVNNICNKCKMVKYCNAACKKKHRHKHKKDCEEYVRLAAEHAAELHDIELFKEPPSLYGDCPICFQLLPTLDSGHRYMTCCGKVICNGCAYSPVYDNQGNKLDIDKQNECAFCRVVAPKTDEEIIKREKIRVEANDPIAIFNLGCEYRYGSSGFPQDYKKALELFRRAGELGYPKSYYNIGYAYDNGEGVEVDEKKANHYYELAAMQGDSRARYNLGNNEARAGDMERALKHYMIAVRSGCDNDSLMMIKQFYSKGYATKEDYTKALQSHQAYMGEIKSAQRDERLHPMKTVGTVTISTSNK